MPGHSKQAPKTLEYKYYTLKLIARTTAIYLEILRRISGMYEVLIEFRFPPEEEKEKKCKGSPRSLKKLLGVLWLLILGERSAFASGPQFCQSG